MEKRRYSHFIVSELRQAQVPTQMVERLQRQRERGVWMESAHLLRLDDDVLKGSLYTDCVWIYEKRGQAPLELEIGHDHDFDEVLGLVGTNRNDPYDLGGLIEFWIEDEKYMLTRSSLVFIPKGVRHCPLLLHEVRSPIFFFTTGNSTVYDRITGKEY
jgi:hypothetical protein